MTLNYRRIILMRNHQASRTKIFQGCAIQATSHLLADHRSAGLLGAVGVDTERADPEVGANRDPRVAHRDLL